MANSNEKPQAVLLSDAPTKRPSRKRTSTCRRIANTAAGVLVLVVAGYGLFLYYRFMFTAMGRPFPQLFANKTLDEIEEPWMVVRPLVDEDTKFDIVATVRVREWMARRRPAFPVGLDGERVIFSDAIFRGLTLKDKHIHTKVNLSIPLGAFTEESLDNYDLRATFLLVPQSPSLLDHMVGSSTWHPNMDIHKLNTQPENAQCHADKSVTKRQLASVFFGITIPLIEFNPTKSACGKDKEGPSWEAEDVASLHKSSVVSAKGRPPLQAHPYVITRTDLRVVNMTDLYDVRGWMMVHQSLGSNATNPMQCPSRLFTKPAIEDLWNCQRAFRPWGNTEVGIKVSVPNEKDGGNATALAYAPFLEVPYRSWGPLDLVRLPVNRENCPVESGAKSSAQDYQSKDVVWNVAFSASSPARLELAKLLATSLQYNLTDTEFNKAVDQIRSERFSAVGGHLFSLTNNTPRKWLIDETVVYLFRIARILYVLYWAQLSTTEGISVVGSGLLSISYLLPLLSELLPRLVDRSSASDHGLSFDIIAKSLIALGIWKTLLHLTVSRSFPFLGRRRASDGGCWTRKLERSSLGMGVIVVFLAATFLSLLDEAKQEAITVLQALDPLPTAISQTEQQATHGRLRNLLSIMDSS